MKIKEILRELERFAPLDLQEDYDNAGHVVGSGEDEAMGCLICLDVTEDVVEEAVRRNCNLIVSHHPVIFKGLKKLTGRSYTERTVMKALRANISIFSMHTNLDNVFQGVNKILCEKIGLINLQVLRRSEGVLRKLVTFCPSAHADQVRNALFQAGAGSIGEYDSCSFNAAGVGSFRAGKLASPFVGEIGDLHFEDEIRIETIFPAHMEEKIIAGLLAAHPYEEVAYDIYKLENRYDKAGAGMTGYLPEKMKEEEFLQKLKDVLHVPCIRHSPLLGKFIEKVAVCGGSGSFLLSDAMHQKADVLVSADFKYHQFFDAEGKIVIADVGHFESEQFTCNLLADYLKEKFANFAIQISETPVNPVKYF